MDLITTTFKLRSPCLYITHLNNKTHASVFIKWYRQLRGRP